MAKNPESLKNILERKIIKLERLTIMYEVNIVERISPKSKKPYKAIQIKVGDKWQQLIFPRSNFEWSYLEEYLETIDETN